MLSQILRRKRTNFRARATFWYQTVLSMCGPWQMLINIQWSLSSNYFSIVVVLLMGMYICGLFICIEVAILPKSSQKWCAFGNLRVLEIPHVMLGSLSFIHVMHV